MLKKTCKMSKYRNIVLSNNWGFYYIYKVSHTVTYLVTSLHTVIYTIYMHFKKCVKRDYCIYTKGMHGNVIIYKLCLVPIKTLQGIIEVHALLTLSTTSQHVLYNKYIIHNNTKYCFCKY